MVSSKKRLLISVIFLLIVLVIIFFVLKIDEDSWIKDSRGMWIKHGNPAISPEKVTAQQDALSCASELYATANLRNTNFSSQCLGKCGDYSIDIVNVPRIMEDDLRENQCTDFIEKKTSGFIELNSQGNLVRIVD
jgi:hypothetical protein